MLMRCATTPIVTAKPTISACSLQERQEIIERTQAGVRATTIAAALGRSVRTVTRWRSAYRRAGADGLAYHSRRPHTRPAHALPDAIVARIGAIRAAHAGWGARLIRRQLLLEGSTPLPSERTVQAWLHRLGAGPVRVPPGKPLGFPQPAPAPRDDTVWELDHKQKGGAAP
jgi:transposase